MSEKPIKYKIIDEVCKEKGIEIINLSYDWITILRKGKQERKMIHYNLNLNSAVSQNLADDKYSTYSLLRFYDIPIIQHQVLFYEKMIPDCETINEDYHILRNNDKVVIKANHSSQGKDVYVSDKEKEKFALVNRLFEEGKDSVVVCPYLEIEYEYRAFFLSGDVFYIYKKQKPFVVGDGKSTIAQLIEKNLKYLKEPLKNLDLSYVPREHEEVIVGWKHNLSNGAIPLIVDENDCYYETIKEMARKAGKALDLTYASVDIVVTKTQEILVMEINASNVVVSKFCELVPNGFEIGKQIYGKVMDEIFKEGNVEK